MQLIVKQVNFYIINCKYLELVKNMTNRTNRCFVGLLSNYRI